MSKKNKRQVSNSEAAAPVAAAPAAPRSSLTTEFNPDYGYVITDLKRIAILAGSFIAVLVILSFIIR